MVQNDIRVTILPKNECTVQTVVSVTVPVKEEVKQILEDKCIREAAENFLKNFGDIKINTDPYAIVMRVVTEYDIPVTLNTINEFSKCMENRSAEFIKKAVEFLEACKCYKAFTVAYRKDLPQQPVKMINRRDLAKKEQCCDVKKEQHYDVVLEGYNHDYTVSVMRAIKSTLNISLSQTKELVSDNNLPSILSTNVDYNTACKIKESIEMRSCGCTNIVVRTTNEQ